MLTTIRARLFLKKIKPIFFKSYIRIRLYTEDSSVLDNTMDWSFVVAEVKKNFALKRKIVDTVSEKSSGLVIGSVDDYLKLIGRGYSYFHSYGGYLYSKNHNSAVVGLTGDYIKLKLSNPVVRSETFNPKLPYNEQHTVRLIKTPAELEESCIELIKVFNRTGE